MRLSTAITLALTALLLTSTVGVAATPSASAFEPDATTVADDSSLSTQPVFTQSSALSMPAALSLAPTESPTDDPKQVIRIAIDEHGNAQWTIESRIILSDEDEVDNFYAYADALAAGERSGFYDRQELRLLAQNAADRTGRDMAIRNAGWDDPRVESFEDVENLDETETDREDDGETVVGILSYSFTWTNFATVEDDYVNVGDVFQSDPNWFMLSDSQRLVIERPPNYALETPTQLTWNGHYEFSDDELEITFVRSGGGGGEPESSGWLLPGVLGLVFVVGVGSYLVTRRRSDIDLPAPLEDLPDRLAALGLPFVGRGRSRALSDRDSREATTDTDGDSGVRSRDVEPGSISQSSGGDSVAGTELEFEEAVDDDIDPELLSDEERVLRMLRQNGGRMKQASIVTETGWSNAKVSQLLSQMDEDDEIEKLRIGRENLITLPEVDPTKLN